MDVLEGHVVEENGQNLGRDLEVIAHPRDGVDHAIDVGQVASAADVGNAVALFEKGRDAHDDRGAGAVGIAANEGRRKRIEVPAGALARGIKTLEIDDGNRSLHRPHSKRGNLQVQALTFRGIDGFEGMSLCQFIAIKMSKIGGRV